MPAYPLTLLTQALILGILAMSLDVLLGYTGLPSLGHAGYFGVAAYAVALLATERQVGLLGCAAAGLALAAVTAAVFGVVAIRARGTYFLMITLALGMVVWGLAFRWVSLTKGDNGVSGVPRPELGSLSLSAPLPFFYFCLLVAAASWTVLGLVVMSPFGLGLKGIRGSESRMEALGYNVWLHKYLAFVISGAFAGAAGVLWAYYNGFVGPTDVQLLTSVEALLMVALGGPGTLVGPALGKDMLGGTELYLDEIGRQVAGRKIELIVEDTEGVTATALTKARKLVDQDRVHILTGGLLASTGYAIHPFADGAKIPTTYPVMSSDDLTQRKPAKWVVRTGWNSSQSMHAFGEWVAKNLKHKKIAVVAFDYAFGWESVGGFQRTFEEQGGQIVQKIWVPLSTTDFAPFLAQIKRDADAVSAASFA